MRQSSKKQKSKKTLKAQKVEKQSGKSKCKKPSFSVEWSRNQVMCRTGKTGPGQSKAIPFGNDSGCAKKAIKQAEKWLQEERVRQGIVWVF